MSRGFPPSPSVGKVPTLVKTVAFSITALEETNADIRLAETEHNNSQVAALVKHIKCSYLHLDRLDARQF